MSVQNILDKSIEFLSSGKIDSAAQTPDNCIEEDTVNHFFKLFNFLNRYLFKFGVHIFR